MKIFSTLFSFLLLTISFSQTKYTVSGKVTQSFHYCGGIAPSQETMMELNTPKAYIGKTFFIKAGKTNSLKNPVLLKVVCDSSGNFSFKLPTGNYFFILPDQVKSMDYNKIVNQKNIQTNINCLKEWWKKPYYEFEIKDKNVITPNFHFVHRCFVSSDIPCLNYIGPMPP